MLIGSVISSTDAASVFSILRSKKLNLKDHTASMLEMESGSNDPMSYMLTLLWITILTGIRYLCLCWCCVSLPLAFWVTVGQRRCFVLNRCNFYIDQEYHIPSGCFRAGLCSAFRSGRQWVSERISLRHRHGNSYLPHKRDLVLTFDVLTGIAQMVIFFLLGLLVTPSQLPAVFLPSVLIMAFLTLVARPFPWLRCFVPSVLPKNRLSGFLVWAAGSRFHCVYIQAVLSGAPMEYNLFNLVFCIVLLSISLQGTLLAPMAHKLG